MEKLGRTRREELILILATDSKVRQSKTLTSLVWFGFTVFLDFKISCCFCGEVVRVGSLNGPKSQPGIIHSQEGSQPDSSTNTDCLKVSLRSYTIWDHGQKIHHKL